MFLNVGARGLAHRIFAQPSLQHQQHRRAFIVNQPVVDAFGFFAVLHIHADGARVRPFVDFHNAIPLGDGEYMRALRDLLLVHYFFGDPRGESLAQPDVRPACLSDQIPEPLMADFVGLQIPQGRKARPRFLVRREKELAGKK